jgi:hypothetical protein
MGISRSVVKRGGYGLLLRKKEKVAAGIERVVGAKAQYSDDFMEKLKKVKSRRKVNKTHADETGAQKKVRKLYKKYKDK